MKKLYLITILLFISSVLKAQTTLSAGDLIVVGLSANINTCNGSTTGGQDEISFVCFRDIAVGTTFDITDNGYERTTAGKFGDTEGVLRITRTTSTLTAGTVFTFTFSATGIVNPAGGWTFSTVTGGGALTAFNMNSGGDQLFLFQGGTWTNPAGTHDATYVGGRFISAFNSKTTWVADGGTQQSNKFPGYPCFHFAPASVTDFTKYTGALTSTSQRLWIDRINNATNWSAYTSCALYNSGGTNYRAGFTLPLSAGGFSDGIWEGTKSTNWFDCENWQSMVVPTQTTNVTIPNTANNAEIIYTAAFSDEYKDTAYCNNITIDADKVALEGNPLNILKVYGNLTINTGGELDMSDGSTGTPDGQLFLFGNWNNLRDETFFKEGESTVHFVGSADQNLAITTGTVEPFYNLTINKPAGSLSLTDDIQVDKNETATGGVLKLIAGKINANGKNVWVSTSATNAIQNHNNNSYIYGGTLKRLVAANTVYDLPIGSATNYNLATVSIAAGATIAGSPDYLNASFSTTISGTAPSLTEGANSYNALLDNGIWTISPSSTFAGSYSVTLKGKGYTNGGKANYTVLKRDNASSAWGLYGTVGTNSEAAGVVTTNRTAITSFSDFAIGLNNPVLPLELLSFDALALKSDTKLIWKVGFEKNVSKYEIEYSKDAKSFKTIGEVKATNQPSYLFIDENAEEGFNYYRLKMIDFDEQFTFSEIEAVKIENVVKPEVTVYPNPATDYLLINSDNIIKTVKLMDILSREIAFEVNYQNDNINISHLKKGVYYLQIDFANDIQQSHSQLIIVK